MKNEERRIEGRIKRGAERRIKRGEK